MTLSGILVCVWVLVAHVGSVLPTKDYHWRFAYVLMAFGGPLWVWFVSDYGVVWGAVVLIAAGSIFRWPLWYLWRYLSGKSKGRS